MKWFWMLTVPVAAVLCWAAVTMGALNQDEGWYLYAANLVAEGKMVYKDFFFTQAPMMPIVYSAFVWVWKAWGLCGARVLTLIIGLSGIAFAVATARRLVDGARRGEVSILVFLLLATNLYHLYYLAIPKTYALAALFVMIAFFNLTFVDVDRKWLARAGALGCGLALAFAAGTRISLGAILPVVGVWLLLTRRWQGLAWFCLGGFLGLAVVSVPCLADVGAREGFFAAQRYHAARGGSDVVWTVGSLSRLVRWYLPVFVVAGLGGFRKAWVILAGFLAVFAVQLVAPFPYEDYQVPIISLLAVFAAVNFAGCGYAKGVLMVLGMCFACSFGSPLLEKWSTNGQDRFWSLKKEKYELRQLQDVAKEIEILDPGGKDLLTQDLYLAVETGRKVPKGLEMGPFSDMTDEQWRALLESAPCKVAALSGYSFAICPPKCDERPVSSQMEMWGLVKSHYEMVDRVVDFGQNATPLLLLKRK